MGRKRARQTNNLAVLAVLIAAAALGIGYFIESQLRPYRLFFLFPSRERGWRDQAFEIALYAGVAAILLAVIARSIRRA